MPIITPDKVTLYNSIFNPMKEDFMKKIDDMILEANSDFELIDELTKLKNEDSEAIIGFDRLSTILTNAVENYLKNTIVEINPGIQVEVKYVETASRGEFQAKTISVGTSKTETQRTTPDTTLAGAFESKTGNSV